MKERSRRALNIEKEIEKEVADPIVPSWWLVSH
jgi:hypothetical protein